MPEEAFFDPEKVAYWYFRLNGFLTIQNFVVHPDYGWKQRTDVDILGVRFPYRAELLENPMVDDEVFTKVTDKPYIVIAEVKTNTCKLNGPWTKSEAKNMPRVLRAIGAFDEKESLCIAEKIYNEGVFENELYYLSLFCIGSQKNIDLKKQFANVPQIIWEDILKFIFNRFRKYQKQKSSHPQWDETAKKLWAIAMDSKDENEFLNYIKIGDE